MIELDDVVVALILEIVMVVVVDRVVKVKLVTVKRHDQLNSPRSDRLAISVEVAAAVSSMEDVSKTGT